MPHELGAAPSRAPLPLAASLAEVWQRSLTRGHLVRIADLHVFELLPAFFGAQHAGGLRGQEARAGSVARGGRAVEDERAMVLLSSESASRSRCPAA